VLDKPTLPDWLQSMEIEGLQLAGKQLHLRLIRSGERTEVIPSRDNEIEIEIKS